MKRVAAVLVIVWSRRWCVAPLAAPRCGAWGPDRRPPPTVWLCRPHLAHNPCTRDRTATLVAADGTTRSEHPVTAKSRPVDCFYVYPTVSLQPTINANLDIDPNQISVAIAQASRFSQVCRVYAPIYRQLTLAAIGGGATRAAAALAYGDVRSAWRDYLAHDNHGRGVVLIGHSQGAGMLTQLVKQEIDPNPKVRRKLTSALLLGGNVLVPRGDVGGDFKHIPACRAATRPAASSRTPRSTSRRRPTRSSGGGHRVQPGARHGAIGIRGPLREPGALLGGRRVTPTTRRTLDLGCSAARCPRAPRVPTPWVSYPGLLKGAGENGASWLRSASSGPGDVRPQLIDSLGPGWGLHLVDVNIVQGDLVRLVGRQGAAWAKKQSSWSDLPARERQQAVFGRRVAGDGLLGVEHARGLAAPGRSSAGRPSVRSR